MSRGYINLEIEIKKDVENRPKFGFENKGFKTGKWTFSIGWRTISHGELPRRSSVSNQIIYVLVTWIPGVNLLIQPNRTLVRGYPIIKQKVCVGVLSRALICMETLK